MRTRIACFLFGVFLAILPLVTSRAQTPQPEGTFSTRIIQVEGTPVTLSPDGQWIAGINGEDTICIWDIANLDPHCATTGDPIETMSIAWAPDSSAIAFSTGILMANAIDSDIFLFDPTGTLQDLTPPSAQDGTPVTATPVTSAETLHVVDTYPAWSPDSASIAFARTTLKQHITGDVVSDGVVLMHMTRTGDDLQAIATLSDDPNATITAPSFWLPDDRIVISIMIRARFPEVLLVDLAGDATPGSMFGEFSGVVVRDASPDGEMLSLTVLDQIGTGVAAIAETRSGNVTVLDHYQPAAGLLIDSPPGFSPTGDTVVYRAILESGFTPVVAIGLDNPIIIPLDDATGPQGTTRTPDWAANDTILVPFRQTAGDAALLITLP